MANIGSEVERAIRWRKKGNTAYCQMAIVRALELLDVTLEISYPFPVLKEVARARELLIDYFFGCNEHQTSDSLWQKYFHAFTLIASKAHCSVQEINSYSP